MKRLIATLTLVPTLAWGGTLDAVTGDLVASVGQMKLDQIVDGEKGLLALKGRETFLILVAIGRCCSYPPTGPSKWHTFSARNKKHFP